jgi:hypothetical protein
MIYGGNTLKNSKYSNTHPLDLSVPSVSLLTFLEYKIMHLSYLIVSFLWIAFLCEWAEP